MASLAFAILRLIKANIRAFHDPEFRALALLTVLLLISGATFYTQHEGWSIVDSLYFCVMTMSTVGYGDLAPTSDISKLFTSIYAVITIGVFVGLVSKLAQTMLKVKADDQDDI